MANISKINGVAIANISKLNGRTLADNDEVMGVIKPATGGTATDYLDENFDGTTNGYGNVPTNWNTDIGNAVYASGKTAVSDRKWTCDASTTPSSTTGPTRAHDSTASDGREGGAADDFMFTEVSGQYSKRFLLRTPELDFSNSLDNDTLQLTFWFHMYGSNIGNLGVAATDSSTSAADTTLGKHFTSDTAGGLTIVYWDTADDDGSSTASGVRITGQQQTTGHGNTTTAAHWRKATVDLNDLAGQSSVYIWFYSKSGSSWRGDVCIDTVKVSGEE